VGPEETRERRSKDKVVDTRGKKLMKIFNKAGLFVTNGVGAEADFTFENTSNGRSVIDLIWVSTASKVGECEEWSEASCCVSEHSMVAVDIEGQREESVVRKRKTGWNRVTKEWKEEGTQRWHRWRHENEQRPVEEMWQAGRGCSRRRQQDWWGKRKAESRSTMKEYGASMYKGWWRPRTG